MTESERDINEFLAEAEDIIETLSSNLFKLREGIDAGKVDPDVLNSIFRSAHTLKGMAGMFGFTEMANLTHKMEDILDSLRMGRLSVNREVITILFDAIDLINQMTAMKSRKEEIDIKRVSEVILRLDGITSSSTLAVSKDDAGIDKNILGVLSEYEEHRLNENIKDGNSIFLIGADFSLAIFDQGLAELSDFLKPLGEVIATLPSQGESKDLLHFDILFASQHEGVFIENLLKERDAHVKVARRGRKSVSVEGGEKEQTEISETLKSEDSVKSITNTVRVDIQKLDNIINTVGELTQLKSSISHIADKISIEAGCRELAFELSKIDKNIEKRLHELQESMIEVRLVPISQLFDKFMRVVRKLSNELSKEVEFRTSGGDTKLDKLIIEDLADPLLHIIRNSIDHGIESVTEREMAGKPRCGIINCRAYQRGNHVIVEIIDDGRGMDTELIRKKAVDKGLVEESHSHTLSEHEIFEFVFIPGFSTKDEVSEVSGRGVGMDVVKKNIARLSGTIDIHAEPGRGTRIIIILPITLAIIPALIIAAGAKRYAIPFGNVLEILNIAPSAIKTMEKREVIVLRSKTIPVVRLEQLFNPESEIRKHSEMTGIIVGIAESMLCVLVDSVVQQQDIVIKSLGKLLKVTGIAGATDIGGIGTLLVVDVAGIMAMLNKTIGEKVA